MERVNCQFSERQAYFFLEPTVKKMGGEENEHKA